MTGTIDFTNCRKILGRAYNGADGKKIAVEYNGREYMLKFPPSGAMKPTELSYTNSCISEHIASSVFNMVGIKAQETLLGNFDRHNGNWGFLYDDSTKAASLAPIYDCGSCLLPQADERIMEQIKGFIDEVPYTTELQKTFYKRYITARFKQILKPAYDMVMSERQE